MEGLILHYYLKIFNLLIITFLLSILLYFFYVINKDLNLSNKLITIKKGERIESFINGNINNISRLEIIVIKLYYHSLQKLLNKFIHYGDFHIENNISALSLFEIISQPSNIINKITIVEGWSKKQLNLELSKYFNKIENIPYEDIIADTYYLEKNKGFNNFTKKLITIKSEYLNNYKESFIYKNFSEIEIMIIGSIIEKEGLGLEDKKIISSVIFNRLNKKMKLQIDATVIYAFTEGNYSLDRKLLLKDLKIKHPYNTYLYKGLPPKPISYVGKETLDIIFENYKTDFLFYFFNNSLKRHIFSKSFNEHKKKLNDYRDKK